MDNLRATYWEYQGNHNNGVSYIVEDPHDFGVQLVHAVHYWADEKVKGFESVMIQQHRKTDSFGQTFTISAPRKVWELAQNKLKRENY